MTNIEIAENITTTLGGEEGWWSSHAEGVVYNSAMVLLECGFSSDEAQNFIEALVSAIRSEYGE